MMTAMMSLERVKQLMGEPNLCDDDAEKIRDACYCMAELFIEDWQHKRRLKHDKQKPKEDAGEKRTNDN